MFSDLQRPQASPAAGNGKRQKSSASIITTHISPAPNHGDIFEPPVTSFKRRRLDRPVKSKAFLQRWRYRKTLRKALRRAGRHSPPPPSHLQSGHAPTNTRKRFGSPITPAVSIMLTNELVPTNEIAPPPSKRPRMCNVRSSKNLSWLRRKRGHRKPGGDSSTHHFSPSLNDAQKRILLKLRHQRGQRELEHSSPFPFSPTLPDAQTSVLARLANRSVAGYIYVHPFPTNRHGLIIQPATLLRVSDPSSQSPTHDTPSITAAPLASLTGVRELMERWVRSLCPPVADASSEYDRGQIDPANPETLMQLVEDEDVCMGDSTQSTSATTVIVNGDQESRIALPTHRHGDDGEGCGNDVNNNDSDYGENPW
jgi:hypothetical protein